MSLGLKDWAWPTDLVRFENRPMWLTVPYRMIFCNPFPSDSASSPAIVARICRNQDSACGQPMGSKNGLRRALPISEKVARRWSVHRTLPVDVTYSVLGGWVDDRRRDRWNQHGQRVGQPTKGLGLSFHGVGPLGDRREPKFCCRVPVSRASRPVSVDRMTSATSSINPETSPLPDVLTDALRYRYTEDEREASRRPLYPIAAALRPYRDRIMGVLENSGLQLR